MQTIHYPRRDAAADIAAQEALDRLTAELFTWKQGPGAIGGLSLHACWGETSVLAKRYQGYSVCHTYGPIRGCMLLYDRTKNPRWRRMAGDMISTLLFLQCEDGGFRHASNEFEPTYYSIQTCPIHQHMPLLAILDYAAWPHADPDLKELIKPAVDRHWAWFNEHFWRNGNAWQHSLKFDAGWCGVTNQDLVAVAALSAYGKVYGDFSRCEEWGKKVLDTYLSPAYYHEKMGLFERGDAANFVERTPYYRIVLEMLERIYKDVGDERIPAVMDNVISHFFDAAYTAPDGMTHLAWGAVTDPVDKTHIVDWIRTPVVFSDYPELTGFMAGYLKRRPDPQKQEILDALQKTLAAYTFADGSIPASLWPKDPIISVVTTPSGYGGRWYWLIDRLGDRVQDPLREPFAPLRLHRQFGTYTWKTDGPLWVIERDGKRVYGGYKPLTHGVTHGDEPPAAGDFATLDDFDILEILDEF